METQYQPYPKILLLGDSLLEQSAHIKDGFSMAAALQSYYSRRMDVVNRGLSGYNTSQALRLLPQLIPPPSAGEIEYLVILFGANDAVIPNTTGQHIPLEEYRENLRSLLTHPLITAHHPRILLVTPPPIDEVQCEITDATSGSPLSRRATTTANYASAVRDIGTELKGNIVVVDLWKAIMDEALQRTHGQVPDNILLGSKILGRSEALTSLLPDGLHLSGAGYSIFFREIQLAIQNNWPNPVPSGEPSDLFVFPYWRNAPKLER